MNVWTRDDFHTSTHPYLHTSTPLISPPAGKNLNPAKLRDPAGASTRPPLPRLPLLEAMTRLAPLLAASVLAACQGPPPTLDTGTWTGHLTPQNHPEMQIPLAYEVTHDDGALAITLVSEAGTRTALRDVDFADSVLTFTFVEPDAGVPLACSLLPQADGRFVGRCTDAEGKWGLFTMIPPDG